MPAVVYVVGAGPVGLMIAAQYLDAAESILRQSRMLPNPYRFVFIEKRTHYSRQQQIAIWKNTWELLPRAVRKKLAIKGCIRTSPELMGDATCYYYPAQSRAESFPDNTVFNFILQASQLSF